MRPLDRLARRLADLPIPDPRKYDLATEEGRRLYRHHLTTLESIADLLARDIIRANGLGVYEPHAKVATLAMKHYEKWRLHAQASVAIWDRAMAYKSVNESRDLVDRISDWLGVKGTKTQWLAKEDRDLGRALDRWEDAHAKILRERDLLVERLIAAS